MLKKKKKKKENKNEKEEAIVAIKNLFRWLVQLASLRVESLYLRQKIIDKNGENKTRNDQIEPPCVDVSALLHSPQRNGLEMKKG